MPAKYLIIPEGSDAEVRALLSLDAAQIGKLRLILGDRKGSRKGVAISVLGRSWGSATISP